MEWSYLPFLKSKLNMGKINGRDFLDLSQLMNTCGKTKVHKVKVP